MIRVLIVFLLIYSPSLAVAGVADDNLISYIPFNDGTGNFASDTEHQYSSGVILTKGTTFISNGKKGLGISCDGANDFAVISDSVTQWHNFNQPATISIWLKPYDVDLPSQGDVLGTGTGANQWLFYLVGAGGTDGSVAFYDGTGAVNHVTVIKYNKNLWNNIIISRDSVGVLRIYKNGFVQYNNVSAGNGAFNPKYSVTPMRVCGTTPDGLNPVQFDVDELKIWNKTLTDGEIRRVYYEGYPVHIFDSD